MRRVTSLIAGAFLLLAACGDDDGGAHDAGPGPDAAPGCGNGRVEGDEECDDGADNSDTQPDACRNDCTLPVCADGVVDTGEECDGDNLDQTICDDLGFNHGELTCTAACTFDTSACFVCGDAVVDDGEECDSTSFGARNCGTESGRSEGQLACTASCLVDDSGCYQCGDGQLHGPEVCDDGNTIAGDGCSADCLSDESCGNGYVDLAAGEQCDAGAANSDVVPNACRTDCQSAGCGDGVIDAGESCDDTDLGGATCLGLGYQGGQLGCAGCQHDTSLCFVCGDGVCSALERTADCPADCAPVTVAAGAEHACVVLADGTARCWGRNDRGQLGDGTTSLPSSAPVPLAGAPTDLQRIAAGDSHSCATDGNLAMWCWGANDWGQLGNNSTSDSPSPVGVYAMSEASWPAAGLWHSCASTSPCTAFCWGDGTWGTLGDGLETSSTVPVEVVGVTADCVERTTSGNGFSCVSLFWGGVKCWGWNDYGALGNGGGSYELTPVDVVPYLGTIDDIAAGREHVCAVHAFGQVYCWGRGTSGQLGHGATDDENTAVQVVGVVDAVGVDGGRAHSCAVTSTGAVYCWGSNDHGQLGDGSTTPSDTAVPVSGITTAVAVTTGDDFSCALLATGVLRCWGRNNSRQLGDGTATDRALPVDVLGL